MQAKRRIGVVLSVSIVLLLLWPAVQAGALGDVEIAVDTVVRGEPGDVVELVTVPVEADEVGMICLITVIGENNPSPHPNSDLIITSNGDSFEVPDVEAEAGQTTRGSVEAVVLGESVMVEVRLGPDGVFSGGLILTSECAPPEVAAAEATTTVPPTTVVEPEVLAEAATVPAPAVLPQTQVKAASAAQPTFTG
ncbi:MAG: hypothetical protein ACERLM_06825 [Acidimicrobiales bacterium]